ncbi:hypothetical protein J2T05_001684 [Cupriavidus necator]|nr:hypothetical protein [Cupriavidus necator]
MKTYVQIFDGVVYEVIAPLVDKAAERFQLVSGTIQYSSPSLSMSLT